MVISIHISFILVSLKALGISGLKNYLCEKYKIILSHIKMFLYYCQMVLFNVLNCYLFVFVSDVSNEQIAMFLYPIKYNLFRLY